CEATTMIHTHPASEATNSATPSHTIGWRYHAALAGTGTASAPGMALPRGGIALVREVVDVGGQHKDLVVGQTLVPRRHGALAATTDGMLDVFQLAPMQPDMVGEVGRAQRGVALAFGAVAGRAGGEQRLAGGGLGRVVRRAGQAQHVLGQVLD